ncbi:MAG: diaminopimelate epimerase [Venatoribacter sp.]
MSIYLPSLAPFPFSKMQGLGNDFMVIDATQTPFTFKAEQVRLLADRRFGVGFDQLLVIEKAPYAEVDFGYRIFNADGSEVEQCGNGARCFAIFVQKKKLSTKNPIRVATHSGDIELHRLQSGEVQVNMGVPKTEPADIPFIASGHHSEHYKIEVAGELVRLAVVNMGNPHAVIQVSNIDKAPVGRLGPLLEVHPRFPKRVNVGFMQIVSRDHICLRVHERGTGETLACGTGACAAVVTGIRQGRLNRLVTVQLTGGQLKIEWENDSAPVFMSGPAQLLYDGWWCA